MRWRRRFGSSWAREKFNFSEEVELPDVQKHWSGGDRE
jgi:hypothetical protein